MRILRKLITAVAVIAGVIAALVGAQFALIEIGNEVVVVHEPTPSGAIHRSRLWIVDDGGVSWIHPGNANAQWWVQHLDANAIVEVELGTLPHRHRQLPRSAHGKKLHYGSDPPRTDCSCAVGPEIDATSAGSKRA